MTAPVWENFVLKSGDGLSVPFILLWMAGDVTNLFGGMLAGVLPTMIILAVYVSGVIWSSRENSIPSVRGSRDTVPYATASFIHELAVVGHSLQCFAGRNDI